MNKIITKYSIFLLCFIFFTVSAKATHPSKMNATIYETKTVFSSKKEVKKYFYLNLKKIEPHLKEFFYFDKNLIVIEDGNKTNCIGKICTKKTIDYVVYVPYVENIKDNEKIFVKNNWLFIKRKQCEAIGYCEYEKREAIYPTKGLKYLVDEDGGITFAYNGNPDITNYKNKIISFYMLLFVVLLIVFFIIHKIKKIHQKKIN